MRKGCPEDSEQPVWFCQRIALQPLLLSHGRVSQIKDNNTLGRQPPSRYVAVSPGIRPFVASPTSRFGRFLPVPYRIPRPPCSPLRQTFDLAAHVEDLFRPKRPPPEALRREPGSRKRYCRTAHFRPTEGNQTASKPSGWKTPTRSGIAPSPSVFSRELSTAE